MSTNQSINLSNLTYLSSAMGIFYIYFFSIPANFVTKLEILVDVLFKKKKRIKVLNIRIHRGAEARPPPDAVPL